MGTIAVACTLSLGLFSKSIRNLFTKSQANIRYALPEDKTQLTDSEANIGLAVLKEQNQTTDSKENIIGAVSEEAPSYEDKNGNVVYKNPKLLFEGVKISKDQELNFALVITAEDKKLVPVKGNLRGGEYTAYEGSALEALLKIAQDKEPQPHYSGSPISCILKHANNSLVTEEEFFEFILEKDETGTPRICTLNSYSTLDVLSLIKEKNIPINLNEKTATGETLFNFLAGIGKAKITKLILQLDDSVIDQIQDQTQLKKTLKVAFSFLREEIADLLIDAMLKKGIGLSEEESWIIRASKNDCVFSEEEFTQLDPELKVKVFYVANAFGNEDVVKKLRPLVEESAPLFRYGPSILAENMDIVTTRNVIEDFLKDLRQDGLLLTAEEFSELDKTKYICKRDQIGRIQGKKFIEKVVKENGLKHIKVPKKIAVINEGLKEVSFNVYSSLELIPKEDHLQIYAERVEPKNRYLSLEEAIEYMIILEKTGYNDFYGNNIFFCEDGIYFIDTEQKDFSPKSPEFEYIKAIKDCVATPEEAEEFLRVYNMRKKAYDDEEKSREAQQNKYDAAFKNPYKRLSKGFANNVEFTFPLASLE